MTIATDPETVYIITDPLEVPLVFSKLRDTVHIYQNAKFDITHLRRWANIEPRKKLWDTMLLERIIYGGYYDLFALEHLARRHLDKKIDKSLQKSFENASELSKKQIEYAAQDAAITLQIALAQRKVMRKTDFEVWKKVDRPALWAYLDFMGFAINIDAWKTLAEENKKLAEKIAENLPYNPNSPAQVKKELIKQGFSRLPNTRKETLQKFIQKFPDEEASNIARQQLEYKKLQKRYSTYGMNFIENHLERDIQFQADMIYCDYSVVGAETGRTSSSQPNMQNIIKRETNKYRQCFIPRPDNLLLIADYSQQEPAISAHLSQDERMIKIINSGDDIYIRVAKDVFEENVSKGDKRRDTIKEIVLGADYGLSSYGLAREQGISKQEAGRMISRYFRYFPDKARWVNRQRKRKDYVETGMGRRVHLNRYISKCERNALNSPIQGTAADMTKMAVAKLHQEWDYPYPFPVVATVHDEIVLDVPKQHAQKVAKFTKRIMEETAKEVCPSVNIKAEVVIGTTWGDKS
jgi:DNA polymerase-1